MRRIRLFVWWLAVLWACLAAATVSARPLGFTLSTDTLLFLAGNSVVDIEFDTAGGDTTVWVGTGAGASVSTDLGLTWQSFTVAQGLNANSVSALHINGDTVWLGMAHSQDFGGDLFPVGDGFNFTFDYGASWDTSLPAQSTGIGYFSQQVFGMLPFDIGSDPFGIWSACFFGGLIRSIDGGTTWSNVFPSDSSRSDFENKSYRDLANRFFSVTSGRVDAAGDTIETYAGSAGGIQRFLVIDAKAKLAGAPVWSINTDRNGTYRWLAAGAGVTRDSKTPATDLRSFFDSTTAFVLPAATFVSSASPIGAGDPAMVVVGAMSTAGADTVGAGIYRYLETPGQWEALNASMFEGVDTVAYQLLFTNRALFAAGGRAGLWRSVDFGQNWQKVYADPAVVSPDSAVNRVYSLGFDAVSGHLYVGTYDGIYRITLNAAADSAVGFEPPLYRYTVDSPGDTTRSQVIRAMGVFHRASWDLLLWAATHALPGQPAQRSASLYSSDAGLTWQTVLIDLVPWGYEYHRDSIFGATNGGLSIVSLDSVTVVSDTVVPVFRLSDSLELSPPFRCIRKMDDTLLWVGGDAGYARRIGSGPSAGNFNWEIQRYIPRDSVDRIEAFKFSSTGDSSISGDFVIALDIQDHAAEKTVWASTRPVESPQYLGVSRSTDHGRSWFKSLTEVITWNISSYDEHVWAATSGGLYHTVNAGTTWVAVPIVDDANGTRFYDGTEILSVQQLSDSILLAGSEDGIARSADLGQTWTITRSFVGLNTDRAGGADVSVYASPVPYSPVTGNRLRIHYKPAQSGTVRIEIFDFAMQKVATVLDGVPRVGLPGGDPHGTNHYYEEWDATNDKGQPVATGVYFFRVEMPGATQWGKLVILP